MYEAFYKFSDKPFRLTPDHTLLFPSRGHKRAMSYLLYGFEQGEGFVMITGAVGTGKTLLIQTLLDKLTPQGIAVASIASANLDSDDILPAIAAELDLPFEGRGKEALLQDLRHRLTALSMRRRRVILIVDEAQTLTPAALEMLRILSNLEIKGRALMQVFLVGQTELRSVIGRNRLEQLRQRIVATYRLEPMDLAETGAYIRYRLHAVGWTDDPALAPEVFGRVHQASGGIPRKINLIMDRLLLYGCLEEKHALDESALAVVLDELRDEMGGVSQTLESMPVDAAAAGPRPGRAGVTDVDALSPQSRRNDLLLEVLREQEEIRKLLTARAQSS